MGCDVSDDDFINMLCRMCLAVAATGTRSVLTAVSAPPT